MNKDISQFDELTIKKLNDTINVLKDECTNELNTVNYYFWPIIAKEKKKRKSYIWYFTMACCLLFAVVFWIIFKEIVNEYWIFTSLGISFIILFIVFYFMIKVLKRIKKINVEWEKALKKANELKQEINKKTDLAKEYMLKDLKVNNFEAKDLESSSYDDVLEYYNKIKDNLA